MLAFVCLVLGLIIGAFVGIYAVFEQFAELATNATSPEDLEAKINCVSGAFRGLDMETLNAQYQSKS
jgi:hypothetical protein